VSLPKISSRILPDRDTTPLSVHPSRDIHGRQLLEQELSSIRQNDLRNLRLVLARSTLELILLERSGTSTLAPHSLPYITDASRAELTQ